MNAQGAQKIYTTATASADVQGQAIKNKNGTESKAGENGVTASPTSGTGTSSKGTSVGIGASATIAIIGMTVEALVGDYRTLTATALSITADARNDIDTVSVAGADPIARRESSEVVTAQAGSPQVQYVNNSTTKDIAVDASVALGIISNTVTARFGEHANITTSGGDILRTGVILIPATSTTEAVYELANLVLRATQKGETYTGASGFAVGNKAAVGAAAAVNIASSNVQALFLGTGNISGAAKVTATTYNDDESAALATVVGASIDRYLDKLRSVFKYASLGDHPSTGSLNATIVNKLNGFVNPVVTSAGQGANSALSGMPFAASIMRVLNLQLPGAGATSGTTTANNAVSSNTTQGATGQPLTGDTQNGQKINIAAAIAVNYTKHNAKALILGVLSARNVDVKAENRANFRTLGTGLTVTVGDVNSNNVSIGVAVTVNENKTEATAGGTVTARGADNHNSGTLNVTSTLTQNMDGAYKGLLAAQALAGSIAGTGGKVGFAGAVAIAVDRALSAAAIAANAIVKGGDIQVVASDKSKLAVRAGGVTITGASVGMGATFGLVYAQNTVSATVGNGANIAGKSLMVRAEKLRVDASDYALPFDTSALLTVDVQEASKKGLINIKTKEGSGHDGIDVAIDTSDILKLVDLLNYLASVNYYVESIAGTVVGGASASAALSGAVAMAFLNNITTAAIGDSASITLTGGSASDLTVSAQSDTNGRLIGGALSASTAKVGVGLNIAVLSDGDTVHAGIGKNCVINADGDITVSAGADTDVWAITIAAAANSGTGPSIGGGLNVVVTGNDVRADIGEGTTLHALGNVAITASNLADLVLISASLSISGGSAAPGGTVTVIVSENKTYATVGNSVVIEAGGDTLVLAKSIETLIDILASFSGSKGVAVAGNIGVLVSNADTRATVGANASLTSGGNITIKAENDTTSTIILAAVAGGAGSAAVGATVNVVIFAQKALAEVGQYTILRADRNIAVVADATHRSLIITAAGAAGTGITVAAAIPVVVTQSTVGARLGAHADAEAKDTVAVMANLDTKLYNIAGGVALTSGSAGVGATLSTLILKNTVYADVQDYARVVGHANTTLTGLTGIALYNRAERRQGVVVAATAGLQLVMASVSGAAAAGSAAVSGVVNTLVAQNSIQAKIGNHVAVNANVERAANGVIISSSESGASGPEQDVLVEAEDDSELYNLAGAVSAASNAGVGATVVTLVYNHTVAADVGTGVVLFANGDVSVLAKAADQLYMLALTFGAAGTAGVAGGANALVYQNHVTAALGGKVTAGGDVTVLSSSSTIMANVLAAGAVGGTAGVTGVAVVTYLYNETLAYVRQGAMLNVSGNVRVAASSVETIVSEAIGASGSGTAAVGGTLMAVVSKLITKAYTEGNVSISGKNISVTAGDTYKLVAIVGTMAVSGTAGVGVSALAAVFFNTVAAELGANNTITASGSVLVSASSNRTANAYVFTAGGGQVGVAGTIAVVVAGSAMNDDAHDGIYASQGGYSAMDPQAQANGAFASAHPAASSHQPEESLTTLLASDGQPVSGIGSDGGSYGQNTSGSSADSSSMNDGLYDSTSGTAHTPAQGPVINGRALADATSALIRGGTKVTAAGNIDVLSGDTLNTDLIAGTLAIGLYAGVGVGVAVAVLFSNVQAVVESGATLNASGNITVKASSGPGSVSVPVIKSGNADTTNINTRVKNDITSAAQSTLRLISVTGTGGLVGVSIAVAALIVNTSSRAVLAGDVTRAANVSVLSEKNFGEVVAVTLAASAGGMAINGSVAVTYYEGAQEASISGTARLSGITGSITVRSTGTTGALSIATALGGGAYAVNGGVAVAINRTRVDTYIGRGVTIMAPTAAIILDTQLNTAAKTIILSAALGTTAAVGFTVALAINRPVALTYIGSTPYGTPVSGSTGTGGGVTAQSVTVQNYVTGDVIITGINVAVGGYVGANGAVALGLSRVVGYAAINGATVHANTIAITAHMDGDVTVSVTSMAGGYVGAGAVVALSQLKTDNRAILDVTGTVVSASSVQVNAGTVAQPYDAQALTSVITGTAGVVAVALNFAIAQNAAGNLAQVLGGLGGSLNAGTLTVYANGNTRAYAVLANASVGGLTVNVSYARADLVGTQEAALKGEATYTVGSLQVQSDQNINNGALGGHSLFFANGNSNNRLLTFGALAHAYLFSAAAGIATATANTAQAEANAIGRALVDAANLNATSAITVWSNGIATARATIKSLGGGYLSIGVSVGTAKTGGTFEALVYTRGNVSTQGGQNITVGTNYSADAVTELTPAISGLGSFSISYYAVKVNTAQASVNTHANAGIGGNGSITAGNVTVSVTGIANALARIETPTFTAGVVTITGNYAKALLNAVQSAFVEDAASLQAASVTVTASFNKDRTDIGAITQLGGNGGSASMQIANGTADAAFAHANASNTAYVRNAGLNVSGALTVKIFGTSYAKAEVVKDTVSLNVAGIGVTIMDAKAEGVFAATVTGGTIRADGGIVIENIYTSTADALGMQPGFGVTASLASLSVNKANAVVSTLADAGILGNGSITAGSLSVRVNGTNTAKALITPAEVSISGVSIAVNQAAAELQATQNAYIDGAAVLNIAGNATVEALLTANANAQTGSNAGGAGVSLVSGNVSKSNASASYRNKAYIRNARLTSANGKATINANSNTTISSTGLSPTLTISAVSYGGVEVIADEDGDTQAYLTGTANITAKQVDVLATGTAAVTAVGNPPRVSVALANGNSVQVTARAGMGAGRITKAYIGTGSSAMAAGLSTGTLYGVNVQATSALTIAASSAKGIAIGAISLGEYDVETLVGSVQTRVAVDGTAVSYEHINVNATDTITATADASIISGGLISAGSSYAKNTVTSQTASASVGSSAKLDAQWNISVQAKTLSTLAATIAGDSYGLGVGSKMLAMNTLTRYTNVTVGDGASIVSAAGDIRIEALADTAQMDGISSGVSGSAIAAGQGPQSVATLTSDTRATVGGGVTIEAVYGLVDIKAISKSDVYAYAYRSAAAIAGSSRSDAQINVYETVKVLINNGGAQKTRIVGEYTTIGAYIGQQKLTSSAYSYTASAGSNTKAYATIVVTSDLDVIVDNAYVGGIERLTVESLVTGMELNSKSYAEIVGATGWVYAESRVEGQYTADVAILTDADLAGYEIIITAESPNVGSSAVKRDATAVANTIVNYVWEKVQEVIKQVVKKVSKIPIIGWFVKWIVKTIIRWIDVLVKYVFYSDAEQKQEGVLTSTGNIAFNGTAHVGGGSAGIYVDIYPDEADASKVLVNASGLDSALKSGGYYTADASSIMLNGIYNNDIGTLTMTAVNGAVTGSGKVFTNTYSPNVVITNHSVKTLILKDVLLYNGSAGAPNVNAGTSFTYLFADERPMLTVSAPGGGDVVFGIGASRITDVGEGTLTINMFGGSVYTAKSAVGDAYVYANRLIVTGAKDIGSANAKFNAYVFEISAYDGVSGVSLGQSKRDTYVYLASSGSVYAQLGFVALYMTPAAAQAAQSAGKLGTLALNGIYAVGTADITLLKTQTITLGTGPDDPISSITIPRNYMEFVLSSDKATVVTLPGGTVSPKPIPVATDGSNSGYFLTETGMVTLPVATTFSAEQYYTADAQFKYYTLPNGAQVITTLDGALVSLVLQNANASTSSYSFSDVNVARDAGGNIVSITFTGSGAAYDKLITFDASGKAMMQVGVNGTATYIESSDFGWVLPNGIRIYYKQVFINSTGGVVSGTYIGKGSTASSRLLLLEDITNAGYGADYRFHVVEVTPKEGGEYAFVNGYVYTREQLLLGIALISGSAMQTLASAQTAAQTALGTITNATLANIFKALAPTGSNTTATDDELTEALANYVTNQIKSVIAANITVQVAMTLAKTVVTQQDSVTTYTTAASYTVTLKEADAYLTAGVQAGSYAFATQNATLAYTVADTSKANKVTLQTVKTPAAVTGTAAMASGSIYDTSSVNSTGHTVTSGKLVVVKTENGYYLQNGAYSFALEQAGSNTAQTYYRLAAMAYTGTALTRYQELTDLLFILEGASGAETLRLIELAQAGSGEITSKTTGGTTSYDYNGGYVKTSGGYLFVDHNNFADGWTAADTTGIKLISGRVVAVFPDGTMSYVAMQLGSGNVKDATISIAPGMTQKIDANGDAVYSEMLYGYYNAFGSLIGAAELAALNISSATFYSTAHQSDAAYWAAVALAASKGLSIKAVVNSGHYTYNTSSDVVFQDIQWHAAGTAADTYKYYVTTKDGAPYNGILMGMNLFMPVFVSVVDGVAQMKKSQYDSIQRYSSSLNITPIYEQLSGSLVLTPVTENGHVGALVSYLGGGSAFYMSADSKGYKIVSQYVRLVDADTASGSMPAGTLLYLNDEYEVAAMLLPNGMFRAYTDGTYGSEGAAYSEYSSNAATGLTVTVSENTPTYLQEIAENLYVTADNFDGYNYNSASFFSYNAEGALVKLTTGWAEFGGVGSGLRYIGSLADPSALTLGNVLARVLYSPEGNVLLTIINNGADGKAVFILPDGAAIDSDGTISSVATGSNRSFAEGAWNTTVAIGTIEAGDVKLTVQTPASGNVTLTDLAGDILEQDIKADRLTFHIAGNAPIFDAANPLVLTPYTMGTETVLSFKPVSGSAYAGKAYITAQGGVHVVDSTFGSAAELYLNILTGNAGFTNIVTAPGSLLDVQVTGGDAFVNGLNVGGTMYLKAAPGGNLNNLVVGASGITVDGGELFINASGDVTTLGAGSAGTVAVQNGGSAAIAAGGTMTLHVLKALTGGTLTLHAGGALIAGDVSALNGTITLTSTNGGASIGDAAISNGTLFVTANGNILFRRMELTSAGKLTLRSINGGLFTTMQDGYLYADNSITTADILLDAGDDFGTAASRIIVDIPQTVTLTFARVNNYYIDAVTLTGSAFARVRPAAPETASGRDQSGAQQQGEYLSDGGQETLGAALSKQTPQELAAWIAGSGRATLNSLISESALAALIQSSVIGNEELNRLLLNDTFTAEQLGSLLGTGGYTALAQRLHAVLTGAQSAVSDSGASSWLAAAIAADNVPNLGNTLAGRLTTEEIQTLIQAAWEKAGYAGTAPADIPARAFGMHIGLSTGVGYVNNAGDIAIAQDTGDVTVGSIRSERGDVTIRAAAGSILGINAPAGVHILGRNIMLQAQGPIGTQTQPLVTEQQANRPTLLGNIASPAATGGVYAPVVVEQVQQMGVDGVMRTVWALRVVVAYTWARVSYPGEATILNAFSAAGGVYVREKTGDLGLGVIKANQAVSLDAPGNIVDTRTVTQRGANEKNITAANVALNAQGGAIGGIGAPILLSVSGNTIAQAYDDIRIADTGDMALTVESEAGRIYAAAEQNLTLTNTALRPGSSKDLLIGVVQAGGRVTVLSLGGVYGPDGAVAIVADSISISAQGDVGSAAGQLVVDTANGSTRSGTLYVKGGTVLLRELSGDLALAGISASGNVSLTVPGSLRDASGGDNAVLLALSAQRAANDARNAANQADATAGVHETYAQRKQAEYANAQANTAAAQTKVDAANAAAAALLVQIEAVRADMQLSAEIRQAILLTLTEQLTAALQYAADLTNTLTAARGLEEAARQAKESAQAAATTARQIADQRMAAALLAQQNADALLISAGLAGRAINSAGRLELYAGGSIGQSGSPLTFSASGTITAQAGDSIYLAGAGDALLYSLTAPNEVSLMALGNIRQAATPNERSMRMRLRAMAATPAASLQAPGVVAGSVSLYAPLGSVGTAATPVWVQVTGINGMAMDGFYVYNTGALEIGTISAGGSVVLTATGSITAAASGSVAPNVTGNTLTLTSGGSIGQSARPLLLDVGNGLTVTGGNLYLGTIGNLPVENVTGDVVVLTVGGVVKVVPGGGTITARELLIQAFGDIGTKDQPISIVVGKTTIGTTLGLVYTYVPSSGGRGGLKPGPGTGTIGVPYTGGTSEIGWLFVAVGLLGLALVLKKRRHA